MSFVAAVVHVLLILFALTGVPAPAQSQERPALSNQERDELNIRRRADELRRSTPIQVDARTDPAYTKFAERTYEQVTEVYGLGLRSLKWQLMASNVLMVLVGFVTISGVGMSAYQLWVSSRLALMHASQKNADAGTAATIKSGEQKIDPGIAVTSLEISPGKVSVQTAFVGIIVLVISAALLLLFVREVYTIHPLNIPSAAALPK